mmetsp:Transcript_38054/g.36430  ORF Transcript_38054/g.36430 Transcript_38054/m.36430 type:complete len:81 (-) Transcript_38054:620-862(-)
MESNQSLNVKIMCLQIYPAHKNIEKSMLKADQLLEEFDAKDNIDILILPEMAFTGYKFTDKEDIKPWLEEAGKGVTFQWC